MDLGDAHGQHVVHGALEGGVELCFICFGDSFLDERHRLVFEHAGGVAAGVAHDGPAGYVGHGFVGAGPFDGEGVG